MARDKSSLDTAKRAKNDEFYTRLEDINDELQHYIHHFKDKHIYLNADNPKYSNFWRWLEERFTDLQLKQLTATYYNEGGQSTVMTLVQRSGGTSVKQSKQLEGDGDFRSDECVALLKQADIVVTNPPFSLFRSYIDQLMAHGKDFIIIGNQNAYTYKNVFPLLKDGAVRIGVNKGAASFIVPCGYENKNVKISEDGTRLVAVAVAWFTTLNHGHTPPPLDLTKVYEGNESDYPYYDNHNAINIDKVKDIPNDYNGVMGVPITFLNKYNPIQFEIIDCMNRYLIIAPVAEKDKGKHMTEINGKRKYARILIKHRKPTQNNPKGGGNH